MNIILENKHSKMVATLCKPGFKILGDITPAQLDLWHMATGVSGEAGELLDAVKKHVVYQKEIDRENVTEELGDLEFYMEGVRRNLGITREETLVANIEKLSVRYAAGKFTKEAAIERADKLPLTSSSDSL